MAFPVPIAVPKGGRRINPKKRFSKTTFEVQGLNTLIEHWFTVAQLTDEISPQIVDFYGDTVIHNARQFVRKLTWATHDSINKDPGVVRSAMGDYSVWIGPTTFYARILEFGKLGNPGYPFMIPAVDMIEKDFINAFGDVANFAKTISGNVSVGGDAGTDARIRGPISSLRGGLYSLSKALGDIAVFGGRDIIRPIRGGAIGGARLIGDMNSIMRGSIANRVTHRLRGRATGRLAGFGSASLTASKTYSGSLAGIGGQRVYNRLVGRNTQGIVTTNLGGF